MSLFIRIVCLLLPVSACAADLEFAGSLEHVSHESILIRLADGVRIDARLPRAGALAAEAITAQYKLADEVQITCKPMAANHCAELKSIRYLRPPTPKERALVLEPPKPASPLDPELERVRQVNLDRAKNMPDFVADETARRYTSSAKADPPEWKLVDTIESDITFKGDEPTRGHIRINGKPWNKPNFPGVTWSVEFGTEIKPVFNPECPTELAFDGHAEVRGKQLLAYVFTSPPDGCFGTANWGRKHYTPAVTGRVLLENPDGAMIQYQEEDGDFPKGFGVQSFRQTITWESIQIAGAPYLLPVTTDFYVGFASGDPWRISVEYKNHRRFEAATSVTFK